MNEEQILAHNRHLHKENEKLRQKNAEFKVQLDNRSPRGKIEAIRKQIDETPESEERGFNYWESTEIENAALIRSNVALNKDNAALLRSNAALKQRNAELENTLHSNNRRLNNLIESYNNQRKVKP